MSSTKEKGKKAVKVGRDEKSDDSVELGEVIESLADIDVKMRLEARDNFGKWSVVVCLPHVSYLV